MHDLGPSQMEHNMNEFMHEFGGAQAGEYHGESPLNEILGEAPLNEGVWLRPHTRVLGYRILAPYRSLRAPSEAPALSWEAYSTIQEAPYQEAYGTYQEAPYQETVASEHEALAGETSAFEGSWNEVLNEDEVLELTSELLEVQNQQEMDRFLGGLFRRVGRLAKGIMRPPIGNLAASALRRVAKIALPMAGSALGTFVGGPAGTLTGGQLANIAGQAMGGSCKNCRRPKRTSRRRVGFVSQRICCDAPETPGVGYPCLARPSPARRSSWRQVCSGATCRACRSVRYLAVTAAGGFAVATRSSSLECNHHVGGPAGQGVPPS